MHVLVIENFPRGPVGLFGAYLERRHGARLEIVTPETAPDAPGAEDLLVVLGSPNGVYENLPWMVRQRGLVRAAIEADRPVVGICFGAQMIASAIGGTVAPFGRPFMGWMANEEVVDPVWRGPWARSHGDHVTLPEGVEVMARDQGTIQAFQYRRAVGVQFHPEADAENLEAWARAKPEELVANGLELEGFIAETRRRVAEDGAARDALFDEIMRRSLFAGERREQAA